MVTNEQPYVVAHSKRRDHMLQGNLRLGLTMGVFAVISVGTLAISRGHATPPPGITVYKTPT